jgi:undecaprenyl-diphosphatase
VGLGVCVIMVALGFAAKTAMLTNAGTRLNEQLVSLRSPAFTTAAKAATTAAHGTVGAGFAVIVPIVLWWVRRRRDALLSASLPLGTLALVLATKSLVAEQRPPQRLWVVPPETRTGFPSSHAAIATALAILVILLARGPYRPVAWVAGISFAGLVAYARIYLGVHYFADVLGGGLAAGGLALLLCGLMDLPAISRRLEDVGTPATGRHHAGRSARASARGER